MKKALLSIMALLLAFGILGCKKEEKIPKIGFAISTTSSGFFAALSASFKTAIEDLGYEFQLAVADGSSTKQIEQIENMITQKVDVIVIMAVDPTSLRDVVQRAMTAKIKVLNFTTDPGAGDIYMGSDQTLIGNSVVQVANTWINSAFASAANGSVKVAIMKFDGTPESTLRSAALQSITNNPKVTLVRTIEVTNTTAAAQAAAENLFLTNPEINVVLTYNSAMALGVNAYVMSQGSAITNKATFGVFGSDTTPEVLQNIKSSATNASVLRGATQLGGNLPYIVAKLVGHVESLLAGTNTVSRDISEVIKIDINNVDSFITPAS
ncbi:MAG: sugar ABC transporter substrate-binding protein [Bacillus subtilis]|nr:sugar ABC transporter substrate-binding protein [Bacillus subtilis]